MTINTCPKPILANQLKGRRRQRNRVSVRLAFLFQLMCLCPARSQLPNRDAAEPAGLVFDSFQNACNVPEFNTGVRGHVGVLGDLVECRDGV